MNWKHLLWIVPLSLFIGAFTYHVLFYNYNLLTMDALINCILELTRYTQ